MRIIAAIIVIFISAELTAAPLIVHSGGSIRRHGDRDNREKCHKAGGEYAMSVDNHGKDFCIISGSAIASSSIKESGEVVPDKVYCRIDGELVGIRKDMAPSPCNP
jgi:hypothetical protein